MFVSCFIKSLPFKMAALFYAVKLITIERSSCLVDFILIIVIKPLLHLLKYVLVL